MSDLARHYDWIYNRCDHYLIKLYDLDGHLLYVAVTYTRNAYVGELRRRHSWGPEIARSEKTKYVGRHSALMAQAEVINNEHPKYGPQASADNAYRGLVR